jgi:hypothetical protein
MENTNKLSQEEVDGLRKSLTNLGMSETEVEDYIEKALKDKEDSTEETVAEKASDTGADDNAEPKEKTDEGEKIAKNTMSEEDIAKCERLKKKKAEIEKAIKDLEEGKGYDDSKDINKSVDNDLSDHKSEDIIKSLGERIDDIQKSLSEKYDSKFAEFEDLVKSIAENVKKIGDTPIGMKSVFTKANFFEKGVEENIGEARELSISKDRDEILKGMQDELGKENDPKTKQMLLDGISDFTVNSTPTAHGIRALAHLARKNNITLGQ